MDMMVLVDHKLTFKIYKIYNLLLLINISYVTDSIFFLNNLIFHYILFAVNIK